MATPMPTRAQLKRNLQALVARLSQKPMDLDARMRVARTYRLLGDKRQAVAHYRSVARYLSLSAQPLQAIAVLKELLQVDPKHEETLLFLAKLYARTRVADGAGRGRVAVPIVDGQGHGPLALPEGMPESATGIWHAIRARGSDVHDRAVAPEALARDDVSIAHELRALDATHELDEDDVLAEQRMPPAPNDDDEPSDPSGEVSADVDGYEVLGALTTEDLVLPRVPFFSSLAPEVFIELGHAMVFGRASAGVSLFKEGDEGDSCIVIARGRARVTKSTDEGREVELMKLGEGDFAGVFALMAETTRQANLIAETDVEYFEIDKEAIADIAKRHPSVETSLIAFFRERIVLNVLAVLPLFSSLSPVERQSLAKAFVDRAYDVDDELFYEGAGRAGLWIVLAGRVRVASDARGDVVYLGPGDFLGSLAGGARGTVDAFAIAVQRTHAALLPQKTLDDVIAHNDADKARRAFADAKLFVTERVFAGNARLPGTIARVAR